MTYDAGNVLDYNNNDPIPDIQACWKEIRAFCIKDHRNTPKDEDCGPGFGEIDHYKLLTPVMNTGLTMPLAFENISEPLVPRPTDPAASTSSRAGRGSTSNRHSRSCKVIDQRSSLSTTMPSTSVSRKSRPWKLYVSFVWSTPKR